MKTIQINLYKFSELSDKAKEKAIDAMYDVNIFDQWWESVYEDAAGIGLKITEFDIDRGSYCKGRLNNSAYEVANSIIENHGEVCDTYKLAKTFINEWDELVKKYSDGIEVDRVTEENEYDFDQEADELEEDFLKDLQEEYLGMLRKEYEYLTSREAIIEAIEANDYDFTEDGKRY